MSKKDLPADTSPLSPYSYWQESVQAWSDFSRTTNKIMLAQMTAGPAGKRQNLDVEADTLATELLRTFSELNLRHWQNMARFLESFPAWAQTPNNLTGSALVDWFDNFQRKTSVPDRAPKHSDARLQQAQQAAPEMLAAPNGSPDDLTRIKGIGLKVQSRLRELGIYHFKQIANWSERETIWVEEYLAYKGRVTREDWVSQARQLSANGASTYH